MRCSRDHAIAHLSLPSFVFARGRPRPFDEHDMHKDGAQNFFTVPKGLAANHIHGQGSDKRPAPASRPRSQWALKNKMQTSTTNGSSLFLLHLLNAFAKGTKTISRHGHGRSRFRGSAPAPRRKCEGSAPRYSYSAPRQVP